MSMNREQRHRQSEREIHREEYLEECMQEQKLRELEIAELAQKLYNDDGYMGDIYEADPGRLQHYENKAQEIIEEEK